MYEYVCIGRKKDEKNGEGMEVHQKEDEEGGSYVATGQPSW